MHSLFHIREYEGTQARAWEELAFQVRKEPGDAVVEIRKTRAPDGGVEWYDVYQDGHQEGFQAKFYADLASAIGDMGKSVKTVAASRVAMTRMTFVVPFDFTDVPSGRTKSDQARWDDAVKRWQKDIPGADRLEFFIIRGGQILAELGLEKNAGRRAFWFGELELSHAWLTKQWDVARNIVGQRYTPAAHTRVGVQDDIAAVALAESYLDTLSDLKRVASDELLNTTHCWGAEKAHAKELSDRLIETPVTSIVAGGTCNLGQLRAVVKEADDAVILQLNVLRDDEFRGHELGRTQDALGQLRAALDSRRARCAEEGAMALTGPSGQGKTHTLLHAAAALLASGTPALVLPGQRFGEGPWWPEVDGQLGGLGVTAEVFLSAFSAMAEASGSRGLLMIDALNESKDPASWSSELRSLLSYTSGLPWVSLLVTWRDDYDDVIEAPKDLVILRHPGFAGAELDALHNYCDFFEIPVPEASLFDPAFSNPLFLRLYCEVRADDPSVDSGGHGRSSLFSRFAAVRSREVLKRLKLSPEADVVTKALDALSDTLINSAGRPVPRSLIETKIDALAPSRTEWPNTLFGSMRSEGLIETIPGRPEELVSFPFQAFSEHLVVSRLLDLTSSDLLATRTVDGLRSSPAFWRAAAVLLPERYGVELCDALEETEHHWRLNEVTLNSLIERDPSSFDDRALQLLEAALDDREDVASAIEVVLALAPRRGHPANSMWLHDKLKAMSMPDRDATWGIATFNLLDDSSACERIIAWAVRRDDRSDDEQVVLSCIPLLWMLISPNRALRDHTTKVLVEQLRNRLPALRELLKLSEGVDDVYLVERLLTICYGAIMRGGDSDLAGAQGLAEAILGWHSKGSVPVNVLARDSARGVIAWAESRGLVTAEDLAELAPPYGALAPTEPPSAEELTRDYGHVDGDPPTWRAHSILGSCLDWMGDFHKYVIASDVDDFSLYLLEDPPPTSRDRFDPKAEVDASWAGRWVAWRAISLGWTPERFAQFEQDRRLHSGREAHKPERFGKKYQWIAHHELMARLADNYHPKLNAWQHEIVPYAGPWPWFGRDIDPSLAVSRERNGSLVATVADDDSSHWLIPSTPSLDSDQSGFEWIADDADLPTVEDLILPTDATKTQWVVLYRHSAWTKSSKHRYRFMMERDQFILQFSWLAKAGTGRDVFELIKSRRLEGRWMPDRSKGRRQYLGEGAWSPIAQAEPAEWEPAGRYGEEGVPVLSASENYLWEGSTLDCSLDETVDFHTPILLLLGSATWEGTRPIWTVNGSVVARALNVLDIEKREHTMLIVNPTWLEERLHELDMELIIGTLGERHADSPQEDDLTSWSDITYAALYAPGATWEMVGPLLTVQRQVE